MKIKITILTAFIVMLTCLDVYSQKPYRVGTTSANFLEIGIGGGAAATGDAHAAATGGGLSSMYWNPASLGYMQGNEAIVNVQPWFAGIDLSMAAFGYVHPSLGSFAASITMMSYGSEQVTTVSNPEGTGETFDGFDFSFNLSYGKKLADWFAFGFTAKYVNTQIWHETASAVAFDLGAIVNTKFFAWSEVPGDGLNIGMSISNYGTRLTYDGIDLKQSIDIEPDENGNYSNVAARYELDSWELPLIFRLGVSFYPFKAENHSLKVLIDALHPNNNSESVNVGGEYALNIPAYGEVFLRGGYKGLFMDESPYGLTLGLGVKVKVFGNQSFKFDYAYGSHETLGAINSFTIGYIF